jgi:hypothetical protein
MWALHRAGRRIVALERGRRKKKSRRWRTAG